MQMEAYKQKDPATVNQLAVPVDIPNYMFLELRTRKDLSPNAVGELTLITFIFYCMLAESHIMELDNDAPISFLYKCLLE